MRELEGICKWLQSYVDSSKKEGKDYTNIIIHNEVLEETVIKPIKQALTPPTVEEVCKEIQKGFYQTVIYRSEINSFGFYDRGEWDYIIHCDREKEHIQIMYALDFETITMIGKFYKGGNK